MTSFEQFSVPAANYCAMGDFLTKHQIGYELIGTWDNTNNVITTAMPAELKAEAIKLFGARDDS